MNEELERLAAVMRRFADEELQGSSPLYERLARGVADDPTLLEPLLAAPRAQRRATLYFAAIHHLVLAGDGGDLAAFFPDVAADHARGNPLPALRTFLADHDAALRARFATHNTQTNEVGRCAFLLPMFATVAAHAGKPLALIEAGASAGLNLLFDRYFYDYGSAGSVGDPAARVRLAPEVRGTSPVPAAMPAVASRVGIDLQPVDVRDDDQIAWLRACIWPEHAERMELFTNAVAAAREDPPHIIRGDVLDALPEAVAGAPAAASVCVFHTATLVYLSHTERAHFAELVHEAGRDRPVWWVAAEGPRILRQVFPDTPIPLREDGYGLVVARAGSDARCVGASSYHGRWVEWSETPA
ncbi:MAG: DUF2332 domain-containing protein [Actinomycetota bacterium]